MKLFSSYSLHQPRGRALRPMARRDGEKKLRMRGHPDWSLELLPLWLYEEGMKKRIADFLEKFAVAALAIGLFQEKGIAVVLGALSFDICLYLQRGLK